MKHPRDDRREAALLLQAWREVEDRCDHGSEDLREHQRYEQRKDEIALLLMSLEEAPGRSKRIRSPDLLAWADSV